MFSASGRFVLAPFLERLELATLEPTTWHPVSCWCCLSLRLPHKSNMLNSMHCI